MIEQRMIPIPPHLKKRFQGAVVALGAELKANFCVADGKSFHWYYGFGDLKEAPAYRAYRRALVKALRTLSGRPLRIVHDAHPQFLSTRLAEELRARRALGAEVLAVQHHQAHVAAAALLAEETRSTLIGMACDGAGWGTDDTIWGCECFGGTLSDLRRLGRLALIPLPGADQAVRQPWRVAVALLYLTYGKKLFRCGVPWLAKKRPRVELMLRLIQRGVHTPQASSAGRLFDGAAALIGLCEEQQNEAEAPRLLEQFALRGEPFGGRGYAAGVRRVQGVDVLQVTSLIRGMVRDVRKKVPRELIAARFHAAFSQWICRLCNSAAREVRAREVVLTGGVFFNSIVRRRVQMSLGRSGLRVHVPEAVGLGDSVISLGQAVMGYVRGSAGSH